ncbi:MAG: OmpA family protein [Gammaproteobacteria bacterium]|nr:OmpA family protein [Gammaproteobacteria bacterium]
MVNARESVLVFVAILLLQAVSGIALAEQPVKPDGASNQPEGGIRSEIIVFSPGFSRGLNVLSDTDYVDLDRLLTLRRSRPVGRVYVFSHTDNSPLSQAARSEFTDNYVLSQARARKVADYIRRVLSLSADQVVATGLGPDYPVADNRMESGRRKNRRFDIFVLTPDQHDSGITLPDLVDMLREDSRKKVAAGNSIPARRVNSIASDRVTLNLNDVELSEVMAMLSRKHRVNILLSKDVSGKVSLNLYDVGIKQAIHSIARVGGYAVESKGGSYFIVNPSDAGKNGHGGVTKLQSFKVQYSKPKSIESILKNHLSRYGKITTLEDRNLLVIEELPEYLASIGKLIRELDRQPKQILIEAKILEVILDDSETFGVDWTRLFDSGDRVRTYGAQGLSLPGSPGFFLDLVTPKMDLALSALSSDGRVRTLSTPKLLALENQEASVIIGDRIGYKVTTTVNQVTTENVQFLESGVILKVKPSVDEDGRVMLDIHPEVSTGSVSEGIPSQSTTEVTTQLLVPDGKTVFIGGLMKMRLSESRSGVPILGRIPLLGRLFSAHEKTSINTETVVMITPHVIETDRTGWAVGHLQKVNETDAVLQDTATRIGRGISSRSLERLDKTAARKSIFKEWSTDGITEAWNASDENIW